MSEPTPDTDVVEAFIGRLVQLRARRGAGPVARLRRGAGTRLGDRPDAMDVFFSLHPPPHGLEEPTYLAATCWAIGEQHAPRLSSLGESLRFLAARGQQGLAHRQLRVLLETDRADLTDPVTRTCRALAAHKIPVNFIRLAWDVASWDHPSHKFRQRLARDFHNAPAFTTTIDDKDA